MFVAGVPVSFPVPSPLSTNVTPEGSGLISVSVGVGTPVEVTGNVPAVPTANETTVVLVGLVIAGATVTLKIKLCEKSAK